MHSRDPSKNLSQKKYEEIRSPGRSHWKVGQGHLEVRYSVEGLPLVSGKAHCRIRMHSVNRYIWQVTLKYQGPVVQSIVSLTSSLRVISLTVLADSIYNILIFFAEKM